MKKILLTTSLLASFVLGANAQWADQTTNLDANIVVTDLKAIDANNVWGIGAGLGTGAPAYQGGCITHDGGANWTKFTVTFTGSTTQDFANISAVDNNTALVAMYKSTGGGGSILRTTDGGATWTKTNAAGQFTNAASFPDVVHMFNASEGIAIGDPVGGFYEIYTTTDGGVTWTQTPNTNSQLSAVQGKEYGIVRLYDAVGDVIWFGANPSDTVNPVNNARIFKSIDKGLTWTVDTTPFPKGIAHICFTDAMNGIASDLYSNELIRTTDGGETWSPLTFTGNVYSFDIAKVPGRSGLYLSSGISTDNSRYARSYSYNGGIDWIEMPNDSDLSTVRISAMAFLSDMLGYGGSSTDVSGGVLKYDGSTGGWLGVPNISAKENFVVYPNPGNSGVFYMNTSNTTNIQVFDMTGKVVYVAIEPAANGIKVDLSSMGKGLYLMKVTSGKVVTTQKLIVQ